MAEKKIEKDIYTTCPFTGQQSAWTEQEFENGSWRGISSVDGSTISADSWDGLRLRYGKLTIARLTQESGQQPHNN